MNRHEEIKFYFNIKDDVALMKEVQSIFGLNLGSVAPGDELKFTWTFLVDYFGNIERRFRYLMSLMDRGQIVLANMEEMQHQECLFLSFVETYKALMRRIDGGFRETLPPVQHLRG